MFGVCAAGTWKLRSVLWPCGHSSTVVLTDPQKRTFGFAPGAAAAAARKAERPAIPSHSRIRMPSASHAAAGECENFAYAATGSAASATSGSFRDRAGRNTVAISAPAMAIAAAITDVVLIASTNAWLEAV